MKGPRRLHPLWLGPWLLRAFLFLLLPLGQALFSGIPISRTLTAAAIAAGIFLFLLWFSSRAWQQGDRLAMEKGLFLRQKSFFSLARCPAVQMKTPVLFRLFRGCLVGLPGRGHRFFLPLPRRMALKLLPSCPGKPLFSSSLPAALCCAFSQSGPLGGIFLLAMWLRRWESLPGTPEHFSSTLETLTSLSALFQTADLVGQLLLWGWLFSFFHRFGCLWPCRLYRVRAAFCCGRAFGRPAAPSLPPGGWFRCCRHGGPPGPLPAAVWLSHCGAVRNVKLFMSLCPAGFPGLVPKWPKGGHSLYTHPTCGCLRFGWGCPFYGPCSLGISSPPSFCCPFSFCPRPSGFGPPGGIVPGLPFFKTDATRLFLRPGAVGYIPAG